MYIHEDRHSNFLFLQQLPDLVFRGQGAGNHFLPIYLFFIGIPKASYKTVQSTI